MKSVKAYGVGTLFSRDIIEPEGKKAFLSLNVEMEPRTYNGTEYRQRVNVKYYGQDMRDVFMNTGEGDLIEFSGDVDAYTVEAKKTGKTYANLRVTGQVSVVKANAPAQRREAHAPAPARTAPAAPTQPDVMDDVPF